MAISKSIIHASGAESTYHKIGLFRGVHEGGLEIEVCHYRDEEYRRRDAPSIPDDSGGVERFAWDEWKHLFDGSPGFAVGVYALLKTREKYADAVDVFEEPEAPEEPEEPDEPPIEEPTEPPAEEGQP